MTSVTSKVCVVGDFAVGKTSVTERFVNNHFSETYLSTVGVKIDTAEIDLPAVDVSHKLVIWDVAGSDEFGPTEFAYLRGANGYVYVADGTRPETLAVVEHIHGQITEKYGHAPFVLLINKRDLSDDWKVSDEYLDALTKAYGNVYRTSAKTGDDVATALTRLSEMIIENEIRGT
ncbi:MAG: Rab family GTPase [Woeseiaceae bacterium]